MGRGRRKKVASPKVTDQSDGTEGSTSDSEKVVYKINPDGRYVCQLCEKTFKTVSVFFQWFAYIENML